MLELVALIGLQASGKSTFRRRRFDATHVVVSKDLLRNNRRPGRRQALLIETALGAGRSVVVDNTHPRVEDRAELIALARRHGARAIGYFLPYTTNVAVARNGKRQGRERVPDVGIFATAKAMREPARNEGFDELYRVLLQDDGSDVIEPMEDTA